MVWGVRGGHLGRCDVVLLPLRPLSPFPLSAPTHLRSESANLAFTPSSFGAEFTVSGFLCPASDNGVDTVRFDPNLRCEAVGNDPCSCLYTWHILPFCIVLFEQWHSACYLTLLNALVCRSDPLNFSDDLLTVSNNGKAGSVALVGASVTQGVAKWEFILLSDDSSACLGVAIKPAQCTLRW